jgi:CheY-like chemotaxis protein
LKILVIEDHSTQLKLAHHVLSAAGHDVTDAAAAEAAFANIKNERPELILLDLSLPGMDGLEIVAKLKADPETRAIPVVAVTSYPERYPLATAMQAGCDHYILKPLNTRLLSAQLTEVLSKQTPP